MPCHTHQDSAAANCFTNRIQTEVQAGQLLRTSVRGCTAECMYSGLQSWLRPSVAWEAASAQRPANGAASCASHRIHIVREISGDPIALVSSLLLIAFYLGQILFVSPLPSLLHGCTAGVGAAGRCAGEHAPLIANAWSCHCGAKYTVQTCITTLDHQVSREKKRKSLSTVTFSED